MVLIDAVGTDSGTGHRMQPIENDNVPGAWRLV